jgi:threonine dehydratase
LTFPILRRRRVAIITVEDRQLLRGMRIAFQELGVVCEPSGAAALAALHSHPLPSHVRSIGLVLTGSNISPEGFSALLARATAEQR